MKILVWGTGNYAKKFVKSFDKEILAFVDRDDSKKFFMGKRVIQPDSLMNISYDCLIIANVYTSEIYAECQKRKIDMNKVIFLYDNYKITNLNQNNKLIESIFENAGGGYAIIANAI